VIDSYNLFIYLLIFIYFFFVTEVTVKDTGGSGWNVQERSNLAKLRADLVM